MAGFSNSPTGEDALGVWDMEYGASRPCPICNAHPLHRVKYRDKPNVDSYVAEAPGLLIRNKKTKNFIRTIGINCGCYAKVHRQIAHIQGGRK